MENGEITDGQITASSSRNRFPPRYARLNGHSCWQLRSNEPTEWIQVDFEQSVWLTGVATQGANPDGYLGYVSAYTVQYKDSSSNWQNIPNRENTNKVGEAVVWNGSNVLKILDN